MTSKKISLIIIGILISANFLWAQSIVDQFFGKEDPEFLIKLEMQVRPHPQARKLGQAFMAHHQPLYEVFDPTTNQFAGTVNGNIYIRQMEEDGIDVLAKANEGWYWYADNMMWSPDGNYLVAKQIDDRAVSRIKLSQKSPVDITENSYAFAGSPVEKNQFYIVHIESGEKLTVEQDHSLPYAHVVGWSKSNETIFLIQSDRLSKDVRLYGVDIKSGNSTLILKETTDTYIVGLNLLQGYSRHLLDMKLVTFLDDRKQFIWMSERSGYNQLYLYDYKGKFIRELTDYSTNGIVGQLSEVDLQNGWVYYFSHSNAQNPYRFQLFRTSLTNQTNAKLIDGPLIPDLPIFIDNNYDSIYIMRDALPDVLQMDLYQSNGTFVKTVWEGNEEVIKNNKPNYEYQRVLARDNKTMLECMILKPVDFDPNKSYPVVENIYGGAFDNMVPRDLSNNRLWRMQNLANEGFVIVFIDGRGTADRGKVFQDFAYGQFGQVEIQEHIDVLKKVAKTRPYLDLNRVGIQGHSWGGHFTLRALIEAPDFYKVGVMSAGPIDPADFRVAIEPYMGCLPQDCPEKYKSAQLSDKLNHLKGQLLIVHGTADDDVPIGESYKLVEKLDAMGYENYEFVEFQGFHHYIDNHKDWPSLSIDYFNKHLK